MNKSRRNQHRDNQLFDLPASPVDLMAEVGIEEEQARAALHHLIKNGWVVAPRIPTNAMLVSYIHSYGERPTRTSSTVTAMGKAKKRWAAMALSGSALALSRHYKRDQQADDSPFQDQG